jgi:hypothetical protein
MDTALQGSMSALNGLDLVLWVGFLAVATRLLSWAYAKPARALPQVVAQPVARTGRPTQLKLAV